jgi:hypothetical protein
MTKNEYLAAIASAFIGIKEQSENHGQMVDIFQSSTKTSGQPWCASFVWYCIDRVDLYQSYVEPNLATKSTATRSASVLSFWNGSNHMRCDPKPGSVICYQMYRGGNPTVLGHCGIVLNVAGDKLLTVEGNTTDVNSINREGDSVVLKHRSVYGSDTMRILGCIDPWGK